jgi:hypothetical protein
MIRPPLRLARTEQLPAPATDDDSLQVPRRRDRPARPAQHGLLARRLHRPAARPGQPDRPGRTAPAPAVHDARDQELTLGQISELLNTTTAVTAARRHRGKP